MYEIWLKDQDDTMLGKDLKIENDEEYVIRDLKTLEKTYKYGKELLGTQVPFNISNKLDSADYGEFTAQRHYTITKVPKNFKKLGIVSREYIGKIAFMNYFTLLSLRGGLKIALLSKTEDINFMLLDGEWLVNDETVISGYGCDLRLLDVIPDNKINARRKAIRRKILLGESGENPEYELFSSLSHQDYGIMNKLGCINIKTGEILEWDEFRTRLFTPRSESFKPFKCCIVNFQDIEQTTKRNFKLKKSANCIGWSSETWSYCTGKLSKVVDTLGGEETLFFYSNFTNGKQGTNRFYREQRLLPGQVCTFKYNNYTYTLIGGTGFAFLDTGKSLYAVRCDDYYSAMPYIHEDGVSVITYSGKNADIFELNITMQDVNTMLDTCETVYDISSMVESHIVNCVGKTIRG